MLTGKIFRINEFSVHDGPGIRVTVFLKGCPLMCPWCHNPEGLLNIQKADKGCSHYKDFEYNSYQLASLILEYAEYLQENDGGVTFSGGEPLFQGLFLQEVMSILKGKVHITVDTSGYAENDIFRQVAFLADVFLYDIKLMDEQLHLKFTGKSNKLILRNIESAFEMRKDIIVRIPLIPTVTDTYENILAIASFLEKFDKRFTVELLPYNKLTGAKYQRINIPFKPDFDESLPVQTHINVFREKNIKVRVL